MLEAERRPAPALATARFHAGRVWARASLGNDGSKRGGSSTTTASATTVYGDPDGLDRPWSLDLIPLLDSVRAMGSAERGVKRSARDCSTGCSRIYTGPAETVLKGLLPPELLWANSGFLRPCHGSAFRRTAALAAIFIRRTSCARPAGEFQVLSDRTQAPSGSGYSLGKSHRAFAHAALGIPSVQRGAAGVVLFVAAEYPRFPGARQPRKSPHRLAHARAI